MKKRNQRRVIRPKKATTPTVKRIEVAFALERAEAQRVYLCGDFNDWRATTLPMIRRGACRWEKRVTLPPGRYEYKFIVDGHWSPDPYRSQEVVNAFGSTNSVLDVLPKRPRGK